MVSRSVCIMRRVNSGFRVSSGIAFQSVSGMFNSLRPVRARYHVVSFAWGYRMKGVVLAGGTGSRLFPLTKITNKHLLPVYDKPMIYYPIQTLVDAGISDILIVTGGRNAGDFLRLLANGKEFGLK